MGGGDGKDDESINVLTKLFETYEGLHAQNPEDLGVYEFFKHLEAAITLTRECNLKRR
jgi:hypothetical protein